MRAFNVLLLLRGVFRLPLMMAALFSLASCATMLERADPEYDRQMAFAVSDGKSSEVVGVWVAKSTLTNGGYSMKEVLLLRPDGTARARVMGMDPGPITWHYTGGGVWQAYVTGRSGVTSSDSNCTIRYVKPTAHAGPRLLIDMHWKTMFGGVTHREVYVNPDDQAAVAAVLLKH